MSQRGGRAAVPCDAQAGPELVCDWATEARLTNQGVNGLLLGPVLVRRHLWQEGRVALMPGDVICTRALRIAALVALRAAGLTARDLACMASLIEA